MNASMRRRIFGFEDRMIEQIDRILHPNQVQEVEEKGKEVKSTVFKLGEVARSSQ